MIFFARFFAAVIFGGDFCGCEFLMVIWLYDTCAASFAPWAFEPRHLRRTTFAPQNIRHKIIIDL
jgi:hypothetical protein